MIEPTRDYPGVEELRQLAMEDLNKAVCCSLESTIAYVKERALPLHPDSLRALAYETVQKNQAVSAETERNMVNE